jgi:hypothetical protein
LDGGAVGEIEGVGFEALGGVVYFKAYIWRRIYNDV